MAAIHPTAAKVQQRLHDRGLEIEVVTLPDSARTAQEAASAIGVEVGQIVKSLVFNRGGVPVLVLTAGDRQVDTQRLNLTRANADEVRRVTGFAIGGIPPLGHDTEIETIIDESFRRFATVWAAAGHPHAVFEVETEALITAIPNSTVTDVS
jgi:prolyl-tRNA editing enzyme YbaK/EbsC (Cys-tRNA(Pro) deacylase)